MLCVELNSFFLPSCPHLGHSALMQAEFANFFVFFELGGKMKENLSAGWALPPWCVARMEEH